jgi:hypothetical protein
VNLRRKELASPRDKRFQLLKIVAQHHLELPKLRRSQINLQVQKLIEECQLAHKELVLVNCIKLTLVLLHLIFPKKLTSVKSNLKQLLFKKNKWKLSFLHITIHLFELRNKQISLVFIKQNLIKNQMLLGNLS